VRSERKVISGGQFWGVTVEVSEEVEVALAWFWAVVRRCRLDGMLDVRVISRVEGESAK
jgi:hypothetical protein